ncbi:hypothetical protein GG681_08840 [Epibacterium sp. SM1969]|uniref:KaiA N-terminal domain-containing protein n=2 Tax=Tritonibacter aquimaris TaxID=2663379 RepID=A0A844ATR8_9RHOB|nr:hypothetical protein [Tritonibacter aquimaris]
MLRFNHQETIAVEEKRKDLTSEQQRRLLQKLVERLSQEHPDFYYQSTSEIAAQLENYILQKDKLSFDDRTLLAPLSRYDIQLLLRLK